MREIMEVPPTTLSVEDPPEIFPNTNMAHDIYNTHVRNRWNVTVSQDRVLDGQIFVIAAMILEVSRIRVVQIYARANDDTAA